MNEVEAVARAIAPSRWEVMDHYLAQTKKKYAGENAAYDPDNFKDRESMAKALAAIAALDAARGDRVAQLAQLTNDEVEAAYRRGRYDGRVQGHISEGRWWCFGVMCGVVLSVLVWSFWP